MRELIVKMSMSADGFVADMNHKNAWMFGADDEAVKWSVDVVRNASLHIMGSKSFRMMAPFYPTSGIPFAPPMNEIPKAVFSKQGETVLMKDGSRYAGNWSDAYVAGGELVQEIEALKSKAGKPIIAHAGVEFVRSLVTHRLVDQFVLLVHPIALGKGHSIFSDLAEPLPLTLTKSIGFPGGAVGQIYRAA